ncbi:phage tail protein [Brucella sp. 2280]|uniref:phage tail-collar fiber domain-containing protein n=2 Tax=unclassified Brucella TaxID=2632610 RepID=UPI00129676C8|nr:phage tail protein [Brucella sp. 2280]QGA56149.1 DUF2793 domain-containing protein [Brucella sp. 2280]QGA56479.1 DUF2793 domain-containing protein [Brucella sp. 2280]
MAQNYFSIVTNIGRNKLALSAAGGAAVTITHFAIGDGNGAEVNPTSASTALVREVWRTPVESVVIDPLNPSAVLVTSIIPTNAGGWWMREFGIFDVDGDMVAVAKPVSQYKPTALEGQLEDIRYEFQIIIGETANVTMLVDPSVLLASRDFVEKRKVLMAQLSLTPWVPVVSMTITAPPSNPAAWDTYCIPAGATGAWAGRSQDIAEWTGSTWRIFTAKDGHGIGLPDGRVFIRINGVYTEWLASRDWVEGRKTPIAMLNSLPWLPVKSITLTAPPATPSEGDLYVIGTGASGAWASKAGQIAEWSDAAWRFSTPPNGHGVSLPDGRVFEKVDGVYVEKIALDAQSGKWGYGVAGGTANALTLTLSPVPSGYIAGMRLAVKITATNTGAATINVAGLGNRPIHYLDGRDLLPGELVAGQTVILNVTDTDIVIASPTVAFLRLTPKGSLQTEQFTASVALSDIQLGVPSIAQQFMLSGVSYIDAWGSVAFRNEATTSVDATGKIALYQGDTLIASSAYIGVSSVNGGRASVSVRRCFDGLDPGATYSLRLLVEKNAAVGPCSANDAHLMAMHD